jgi:integrase/recombinase XerD
MNYIAKKNRYIPESDWIRIRKHLSAEDAYLCEILKATGLRVDDVLESINLNWAFADIGLIVVEEKKTGKIRELESTGWIVTLIRSFREAYGISNFEASVNALFFVPSRKDPFTHLNRSTLFRHFIRACKRAGLNDKGYTIHSLRKCYAVDLMKKTRSILQVQKALNHDRTETTMIYLMDAIEFML